MSIFSWLLPRPLAPKSPNSFIRFLVLLTISSYSSRNSNTPTQLTVSAQETTTIDQSSVHTAGQIKGAYGNPQRGRRKHDYFRWDYNNVTLPKHLSDLSATHALGPDDDGDLVVLIYLIGGCDDVLRTSAVDSNEQTNQERPRVSMFPPCEEVSDQTFSFDPARNKIAKRKQMPRKRFRHEAIVVEGMIWVIGGRDENDDVVTEVDVYNPAHDSWSNVGTLPPDLATSDLAAFARGDNLYIIGGYTQTYHASSTTYMIDTVRTVENDQGLVIDRDLASLHTGRGSTNAVVYGHYAYVAGGYTHEDHFCTPLATVERYDTKNNLWVEVDGLDEGRAGSAFVKFDGQLISMWGDKSDESSCSSTTSNQTTHATVDADTVDTIEIYNPLEFRDAIWRRVSSPKHDGRMRFAAVSWPATRSIYLFGGMIDGPEGCLCYYGSDSIVEYYPAEEEGGDGVLKTSLKTVVGLGLGLPLSLLAVCCGFVFVRRKKQVDGILRNRKKFSEDELELYEENASGDEGVASSRREEEQPVIT